ncbi:ABC transporter substrate-binding protein [Vibrio sp. Isolate34]|uniref:ABC transporter substrate-binding protein n=1 Tax=Vibrio sp. Isolate34 TaxID=2908540 RepID=UPI001EFD249B|nr:ABC transporter substrate-binding protein [Vibrio sp. Isolate34]
MNDVNLRHLDQLLKHFDIRLSHSIGLGELEVALCTSKRNVSIVMKKLSEQGWIEWLPAVGRSNSSKLTIKKSLQQAITELLISELNKGSFKLVSRLVDLYGSTAVRALTLATEHLNQTNELSNAVLIASYPWVNTIDPIKTFRHAELHIAKSVYDVLLVQSPDGDIMPSLAHDWVMEDTRMTLWLRPGVYRHDGEILQVEDVVWSIRRLIEGNGPIKELWQCVERVDAVGPNCLVITLKYANKFFPYMLAMSNASIVCRDIQNFDGQYSYHIGTGPFKIERWCQDSIQLRAHKDYFSTRALLERITLSHANEDMQNMISYNCPSDQVEIQSISALFYLTYRERLGSGISRETWCELAGYIHQQKQLYDPINAVESLAFEPCKAQLEIIACPSLRGKIVLAEPRWTIPYLIRNSQWLHDVIRSTGLELEVMIVDNISHPHLVSELADILLIEDVIEAPIDYGTYEWLSVSTGLRFSFDRFKMDEHLSKVKRAISLDSPKSELIKIEKNLRLSYTYLPLFSGYEEMSRTQQVRGFQVRNTGYSDFYRLWIDQ